MDGDVMGVEIKGGVEVDVCVGSLLGGSVPIHPLPTTCILHIAQRGI